MLLSGLEKSYKARRFEMNKQRDWTISLIRMISTVLIVTCHFMQYLDLELAWWFNVGVQIFLCISGFLYGNKSIDTIGFLKKSFRKILVSFYVVFLPFAAVLLLCNKIDAGTLFSGALMTKTVPGGEHLWFIPTILCCYALTPFLSLYFDHKSRIHIAVKYALALLGTFYIFHHFVPYFNCAWISCYITGFFLAKVDASGTYKIAGACLGILALIANAIQIRCDYFTYTTFYKYSLFCDYAHFLLGVGLFILLRFFFQNAKENKLLRFSDKYSYEVYLVHQFFILGPLSLMRLTPYTAINILLISMLILPCAVIAKLVSTKAHQAIDHLTSKLLNKSSF